MSHSSFKCVETAASLSQARNYLYKGGSHLSQIFWDYEILSSLSVIWIIYIKLYKEKGKKNWQKFWAKWESSLTTVRLKWDPLVYVFSNIYLDITCFAWPLHLKSFQILSENFNPPVFSTI